MSRLAVSLAFLLLLVRSGSGQDRPVQGDVNGDGRRNVSDAVYLLRHLFAGGPAPVDAPCAACDSCCPAVSRVLKTGFNLDFDIEARRVTAEPVPRFSGEDGGDQAGASRHYELATFGSEDPWDWITVDYATGLMWQTRSPNDPFDHVNLASAYCQNLTLGPFDDWRLPTINELLTLLTVSCYGYFNQECDRMLYEDVPRMEAAFFRWRFWPNYAGVHRYWSSTISVAGLLVVVKVQFGSGGFYCHSNLNGSSYARAVRQILPGDLELLGLPEKPSAFYREAPRNGDVDGNGARDVQDAVYLLAYLFTGGPEPASNVCPPCDSCCPDFPARPLQTGADGASDGGVPRSFEVLDFGSDDPWNWVTVDHATGLMWQYAYEPQVLTYAATLTTYREFLDRRLGGFEDWRIPNIFELLSLVNYSPNDTHTYRGMFENPRSGYSLVSSTLEVRYPLALDGCAQGGSAWALCPMYFGLHTQSMTLERGGVFLRLVRTLQPGDLDR